MEIGVGRDFLPHAGGLPSLAGSTLASWLGRGAWRLTAEFERRDRGGGEREQLGHPSPSQPC